MTRAAHQAQPFLSGLASLGSRLENEGPAWLRDLRREGLARFEQLGFPTARQEEWKNTNVGPIASAVFRPGGNGTTVGSASDLPAGARLELGGTRLVFVNGRHAPHLGDGASGTGPWAGGLAGALERHADTVRPRLLGRRSEQGAFGALNDAFLEDAAVIVIPDGASADEPLQILHVSGGTSEPVYSNPRTLIVAGRNSRARVVEIYLGLDEGAYFTNSVTDVLVGDNAALEHYRIQLQSPGAFHISTLTCRQTRDSRYVAHHVDLGGRLARHDVNAVLDGEGAYCRLNGLYLTRDNQHIDNHTVLDHAKPHGDSRELYKGVLDDRSRTVFNGRIIVRPDAQKTDAKQSNPNLLLSRGALAHTRPQLEIYADDVKCTHGATVGRLDEDAIFYLRSRGIDAADARNLMVTAFAGEVLQQIGVEPLRSYLEALIAERLSGAGRSVATR